MDGVDLDEDEEIDQDANGLDTGELVDEPTGDLEERSQQGVGEPV